MVDTISAADIENIHDKNHRSDDSGDFKWKDRQKIYMMLCDPLDE